MVIKSTIDYIPTGYKKLKNKNEQKAKTILDTGIGYYLVNRGIDLICESIN